MKGKLDSVIIVGGAIHMPEYYDSYRLITAYLTYLDKVLDPD